MSQEVKRSNTTNRLKNSLDEKREKARLLKKMRDERNRQSFDRKERHKKQMEEVENLFDENTSPNAGEGAEADSSQLHTSATLSDIASVSSIQQSQPAESSHSHEGAASPMSVGSDSPPQCEEELMPPPARPAPREPEERSECSEAEGEAGEGEAEEGVEEEEQAQDVSVEETMSGGEGQTAEAEDQPTEMPTVTHEHEDSDSDFDSEDEERFRQMAEYLHPKAVERIRNEERQERRDKKIRMAKRANSKAVSFIRSTTKLAKKRGGPSKAKLQKKADKKQKEEAAMAAYLHPDAVKKIQMEEDKRRKKEAKNQTLDAFLKF